MSEAAPQTGAVPAAPPITTPVAASGNGAAGPTTPAPGTDKAAPASAAPAETSEVESLLDMEPAAVKLAVEKLKFPEGIKADSPEAKDFIGLAEKLKLSEAAAQGLIDWNTAKMTAQTKSAEQAWLKETQKWAAEIKADKEYGGAAFEENLALAKKAISKFGSPGLVELFKTTGIGNHPELIKAFVRAGKAISEDSLSGTTSQGPAGNNQQAKLAAMYPTMFPK